MAGMAIVPSNMSIRTLPDGQAVLQPRRRRRRNRLSAQARRRIAANARKFKFPLLTGGVILGTSLKIMRENGLGLTDLFSSRGGYLFLHDTVRRYTGFSIENGSFDVREMSKGLLPLAAVMTASKFGIFKKANQALARSRIPIRLS